MKRLLTICLATLTLAACEKKDSLPNQETTPQLLELKTGDEHVKLQYAPDGKVSKAIVKSEDDNNGEEVEYLINYNAAGKISEILSSDNETIRPVYTNGKLTKAEILMANQVIGYNEYTYENDLVKEITMIFIDDNDPVVTSKFKLSYNAQKQVVKSEYSLLNIFTGELEPAGYTTMEYDNKNNPLYSIREFMLILSDVPATNNIAKETQFDENNALDETREYTYTYNSKGYPTAAVLRSTFPGQPATTTNLTYTYR